MKLVIAYILATVLAVIALVTVGDLSNLGRESFVEGLSNHRKSSSPEFHYMDWVEVTGGFYEYSEGQIWEQCEGGYKLTVAGYLTECIPAKYIKESEITDGNG